MVKEEQVIVYKCKCAFCSHEWRAWDLPLRCSSCKRPGWNRDSKAKIEEKPILDSQGNLTGMEQSWTEVLPEKELVTLSNTTTSGSGGWDRDNYRHNYVERELVSLDDILSWTPKRKV